MRSSRAVSGIAGVKAPAFIERAILRRRGAIAGGIAGVKAPAFIERAPMGTSKSGFSLGLRG